ncbi:hypothetical protein Plhal703r1_c30g0119961 [Plasmopara halstedii]
MDKRVHPKKYIMPLSVGRSSLSEKVNVPSSPKGPDSSMICQLDSMRKGIFPFVANSWRDLLTKAALRGFTGVGDDMLMIGGSVDKLQAQERHQQAMTDSGKTLVQDIKLFQNDVGSVTII